MFIDYETLEDLVDQIKDSLNHSHIIGQICKVITSTGVVCYSTLHNIVYWCKYRNVNNVDPFISVPLYTPIGDFSVLIPRRRPVDTIISIMVDGIDRTEELMLYAGPEYNWFGRNVTPKLFKSKVVEVYTVHNDDVMVFSEDEYINLCKQKHN